VLIRGWRAAPHLVWTCYDDSDDWVVFDPRCGDVHLLSAAARVLWDLIDRSPSLSTSQLVAALADRLDRAADEELATVTCETLDFMDRAGLVTPELQ